MAKVIMFDGVDGSGKSTIINDVYKSLREKHYTSKILIDFGSSPIGKLAREFYLNKENKNISILNKFLLTWLSRIELFSKEITKEKADGIDFLLIDRSLLSSYIYNIELAKELMEGKAFDDYLESIHIISNELIRVAFLNNEVVKEGHLFVVLTCEEHEAKRRTSGDDWLEEHNSNFFKNINEQYKKIGEQFKNSIVIDNTEFKRSNVDSIIKEILKED